MATVKQCDLCGTIYPLEEPGFFQNLVDSINSAFGNVDQVVHLHDPSGRTLDLCPECTAELNEWVRKKQE